MEEAQWSQYSHVGPLHLNGHLIPMYLLYHILTILYAMQKKNPSQVAQNLEALKATSSETSKSAIWPRVITSNLIVLDLERLSVNNPLVITKCTLFLNHNWNCIGGAVR